MFGKGWCIANPQLCDGVFPYLSWSFLIWGLITFYRIYKNRKRGFEEYLAAPLFSILGILGLWVNYVD